MRRFLISLAVIASAALTTLPAGAGPADNEKKPKPLMWPSDVALTPCNFKREFVGDWTVQDEKDAVHRVGRSAVLNLRSDETYSNAALLGALIWGYSWSWDSAWVIAAGDSGSSFDLAGPHSCAVRYSTDPAKGCSSTYEVWYDAQWEWEIGAGSGHAELEVKGVMSAQFQDQVLADPDAAGGVSRFFGDRAFGQRGGRGTISVGGFDLPFDTATSADTDVPPDGDAVRVQGDHKVPIAFTGDLLTVRSYAKVRSYVDEPGMVNEGDVACWIHSADPRLRVRFTCTGEPYCLQTTEGRYAK